MNATKIIMLFALHSLKHVVGTHQNPEICTGTCCAREQQRCVCTAREGARWGPAAGLTRRGQSCPSAISAFVPVPLLASGKPRFYSSFPSIKIWLTMPTLLHQNAYFKGLQKGDMSDCHLKRVRRVMCREILDLTFDGSWWWSTSLHVWRDRHHRCLLHGLRLHLPNCLHAHSDDNDCPDPSLPSILSNVNSELRKGTESFFKISVC